MKIQVSMKIIAILILALAAHTFMVGCNGQGASEGQKAENKTQREIENNYAKGQPIPALTNSQTRENLIEIQEAIAEGVSTTSFFFNLGDQDPIDSCPSIGVPIPASTQLTNPEQIINPPGDASAANLPQMDPTGVYTGETTATYVLCVDAKAGPYVSYWEGFVKTEFAPATWNESKHQVELLGPSSWEFSEHTPPSGTTNNPNR